MLSLRRAILALVLLCLGCSAQLNDQDLARRIERQVRGYYNVPNSVQITVGARSASEFPTYDKVTLTFGDGTRKQTHDFLVSKDGKTLVRFTKLDLTADPYAETMKKIDLSGRPVRGKNDAKVTIVNYDDFQCPFCSRMHQTLFPQILDQYKDRVRIIYKDFPLVEIHPWAIRAAVDANCLVAQNNDAYWDFADYVHANQKEINGNAKSNLQASLDKLDHLTLEQGQTHNLDLAKLQACIKAQKEDAVRASMHEAEGLGVSATPTMYINGEKLDGALPAEEVRAAIDRALRDAGAQPAGPAAAQPKPAAEARPPSK